MSELVPATSPFDAIRRADADGEYWTGRELMPLLGYDKWQNFMRAIEQAMIAARLSNVDVTSNFTAVSKVSGARGPNGADYRLSRYASYLVAMRGDSRKPEIAAALTYFAIKTRQAETAPVSQAPALPDLSTTEGQLAVLDMLRDQVERRRALELENAALANERDEVTAYATDLEPDAEAFRTIAKDHVGDYSAKDAAGFLSREPRITIGQNTLIQTLREWKVLDGWDRPYSAHKHHFHLKPRFREDRETGERIPVAPQVRITFNGLSYIRRRLLAELDKAAAVAARTTEPDLFASGNSTRGELTLATRPSGWRNHVPRRTP